MSAAVADYQIVESELSRDTRIRARVPMAAHMKRFQGRANSFASR